MSVSNRSFRQFMVIVILLSTFGLYTLDMEAQEATPDEAIVETTSEGPTESALPTASEIATDGPTATPTETAAVATEETPTVEATLLPTEAMVAPVEQSGVVEEVGVLSGEILTVTTTADEDSQICDETDECSLREAINKANSTTGPNSIHFNIPDSEPKTIEVGSQLPVLTDAYTTIDGTTQSGYMNVPIIELAGGMGSVGHGLVIDSTASNITIKGLVINRFEFAGIQINSTAGDNVIEGNYLGTDINGNLARSNREGIVINGSPNNRIGGTTSGSRNVISGNQRHGISVMGAGSTGNVIQGNYIGTNANGTAGLGNGMDGIQISGEASANSIGGAASGAGNVISANGDNGIMIQGTLGLNIVQGNYIGTDALGMVDLGNGLGGIVIENSTNNVIGGTRTTSLCTGACNLISGNLLGINLMATSNLVQGNNIGTDINGSSALGNDGEGISVSGANNTIGGTGTATANLVSSNIGTGIRLAGSGATGNIVQGNYVGTDTSGEIALGNLGYGILITTGAVNNLIGGTDSGAGNRIAFNGNVGSRAGIAVEGANQNSIQQSSMYSNGGLGIDLSPDGVTLNDSGDGDTGSNDQQNFPVMSNITEVDMVINGTLNSAANTTYRVEFFSTSGCDASGYGEGEEYLGFLDDVTTNGSGNANFTFNLPQMVPLGKRITATATDPSGNTSEFSRCAMVTAAPVPARPTQLAPVNGALVNTDRPTFTWTTVAYGASYQIQIDTNMAFSSPEQDQTVAAASYTPAMGMELAQGLHYWRVRAKNAVGAPGGWTLARSFTVDSIPPAAPALNLPADNAMVSSVKPTFTWYAPPGTNRYRVQVTTDPSFTGDLPIDVETSNRYYTATSALAQGTYYWRVQARDTALNWSLFSSHRTLRVNIQSSPANNSYTTDTTPTFRWVAMPGATSYRLEVANDALFTSPIAGFPYVTPNGWTLLYTTPNPDDLDFGIYYWRVNVNTGLGFVVSPFYFTLTVTPPLPAAPVLGTPANYAIVSDNTPTFIWGVVSGAGEPFRYQIQVDNNSNFSSPEYSDETTASTTSTPVSPLANGNYYWRVRALNTFGAPTAWSAIRSFRVNATPPLAPVLVSPENGATVRGLPAVFSWAASSTAVGYQIQINGWQSPEVTTLTYEYIDCQGTCSWSVRARNAYGLWSDWSSTWTVSVLPGTMSSGPTLVSPVDDGLIHTGRPTFSWNWLVHDDGFIYGGSDIYQVQVDNEADFSSPEYDDSSGGGTSRQMSSTYTIPELDPTYLLYYILSDSVYYWRIRAYNTAAGEYSPWSTVRTFELVNTYSECTPIASGPVTAFISGNIPDGWPYLTRLDISENNPPEGTDQTITVTVRVKPPDGGGPSDPVQSVTAAFIHDYGVTAPMSLTLISGDTLDGQWSGTWTVNNTFCYNYGMRFIATNATAESVLNIAKR